MINKGILVKRIIKGKENSGKGNNLKIKEMFQFFANTIDFNEFYMSLQYGSVKIVFAT